ncbi:MAG: glycosyltransferase family 4 protein [Acidobacteriota bacterium]
MSRSRAHVPTVAIITSVVPSYRAGFYDRLFSRDDLLVDVYCQSDLPGVNVRTIHDRYLARVNLVKAISADNEALSWQRIPWRKILFTYDVVFVDGNPRNLSHAVAATLLRMLRRNVVLWTMGHSYRANRATERIRLLWTRMFKHIFLYTDAEVRAFRADGFARHVLTAMNNGLDQKKIDEVISTWDDGRLAEWRRDHGLDKRTMLLSCTRLEQKNKFDLMVDALPSIQRQVPDVTWCIIGDGPERDRLTAAGKDAGLADHVRFVGELYDEHELAPWFLSAQLLIHPGAIGLTLLHAFGYGLPVVTHGSAERHGPEFGAFQEDLAGRTFRENDSESLAETIVALLRNAPARSSMKRHVQNVARHDYNVDVMVDRFVYTARIAAGANSAPLAGCDSQ